MEYQISNLEVENRIYFSNDGVHFCTNRSAVLLPEIKNTFSAMPEDFFLFESDMVMGHEMVGDGEVPAKYSDWHQRVFLDSSEYYVPSPLLYRKVKDFLYKKGSEEQ